MVGSFLLSLSFEIGNNIAAFLLEPFYKTLMNYMAHYNLVFNNDFLLDSVTLNLT